MIPPIIELLVFRTRDGRWRARLDARDDRRYSEPASTPIEAATRVLVAFGAAEAGVPDVERERAAASLT